MSEASWAERDRRHAAAFDHIGVRYDEAFPHKEGQLAAGEWLLERLPPRARILDVGCGTGLPTAAQLAGEGHDLTGIDQSAGMIELARKNVPSVRFEQKNLFGATGEYDAVVAFFVLLMLRLEEIPRALSYVHSLLRPGGYFCLSMVEADLDDLPISFLGQEVRVSCYLRDDLRDEVEKAGFVIEDQQELSYAPQTTQAVPEIQLFLNCRRP